MKKELAELQEELAQAHTQISRKSDSGVTKEGACSCWCWNTVGSDGCRNCLRKAGKEVRACFPNREGRALNASCYLRYSTDNFYNEEGAAEGRNGPLREGAIIATVLAIAAFLMLSLCASYAAFTKLSKIKKRCF